MSKYTILFLIFIGSCTSKKTTVETKAIQKLLFQSDYSFKQVDECSCRVEGPSVFDGVGTTRWDFNLKHVLEVIDTLPATDVYLKFKSYDNVKVNVLEWYVEMNAQEQHLRSIYNYVPISTHNKTKAYKLIKQFKKAAIKCGAKLKE